MTHAPDCGYHLDQYWWECTCGNLPHCAVCGRAEYGQEKGMICRGMECPKRAKSSPMGETTAPQEHATPSTPPAEPLNPRLSASKDITP